MPKWVVLLRGINVGGHKKIKMADLRRYVSFFADKAVSDLQIPYESPDKDFLIFRVDEREVYSNLYVRPNARPDSMNILEQAYGKAITTRNWNTVVKIAAK